MRRIYPKLVRENYSRQQASGRYNPASVALLTYKRRRYSCVTSHGNSDDEYFWQSGNTVVALAINDRMGYCGLTEFTLGDTPNKYTEKPNRFDGDESGSIFLQYDYEITDTLGPRGLDLSPATIMRKLQEYLQ